MRASKLFAIAILLATPTGLLRAQVGTPVALAGDEIIERVSPSAVLILAGKGSGQLDSLGSGLIIRPDGVILTAGHVVREMREVQVRLKSGEIYDRVALIAEDERRDIAALRIPAAALPAVPVSSSAIVAAGAPVYLVSCGAGLPWTASSGILSALRMADEVPGAGSGYRLLQFTAPIAPGSSGGVLVDAQARALGIVIGTLSGGQNLNFAVPIDSVAGLADAAGGKSFESGAMLRLPGDRVAASSGASPRAPAVQPPVPSDPGLPPVEQLQVRTLTVLSKTIYIRRERLQDELRKTAMFQRLGVRFADYGETADVAITVDRPFLTFEWTYTLVFQPSGLTLATGMIEAADDSDAGPKLAARIMEQLAAAAVLPRGALAEPRTALAPTDTAKRRPSGDPAELLRTCRAIMVESHTIWMKGNLLQDALHIRPELRDWGIRIVDDRAAADLYIDITRPFLTYDWVYKMIDPSTGTVVGTGKVLAIDGSAAAQRLAQEIVGRIRSVRPIPSAREP